MTTICPRCMHEFDPDAEIPHYTPHTLLQPGIRGYIQSLGQCRHCGDVPLISIYDEHDGSTIIELRCHDEVEKTTVAKAFWDTERYGLIKKKTLAMAIKLLRIT